MRRQRYRIFLERKTLGGLPWRVEFGGGFVDCLHFSIAGMCRNGYDADREKSFSVTGTGVIEVDGNTVRITESEA